MENQSTITVIGNAPARTVDVYFNKVYMDSREIEHQHLATLTEAEVEEILDELWSKGFTPTKLKGLKLSKEVDIQEVAKQMRAVADMLDQASGEEETTTEDTEKNGC